MFWEDLKIESLELFTYCACYCVWIWLDPYLLSAFDQRNCCSVKSQSRVSLTAFRVKWKDIIVSLHHQLEEYLFWKAAKYFLNAALNLSSVCLLWPALKLESGFMFTSDPCITKWRSDSLLPIRCQNSGIHFHSFQEGIAGIMWREQWVNCGFKRVTSCTEHVANASPSEDCGLMTASALSSVLMVSGLGELFLLAFNWSLKSF